MPKFVLDDTEHEPSTACPDGSLPGQAAGYKGMEDTSSPGFPHFLHPLPTPGPMHTWHWPLTAVSLALTATLAWWAGATLAQRSGSASVAREPTAHLAAVNSPGPAATRPPTLVTGRDRTDPSPPVMSWTSSVTAAGGGQVVVDVHGDVARPGVYTLPAGARVADAVTAAGGLLHAQDAAGLNAAAPLEDGQAVWVPAATAAAGSPANSSGSPQAQALPQRSGSTGTNAAPAGAQRAPAGPSVQAPVPVVDLNTADTETLTTMPGIGPARAQAMIRYRQQHGGFHDVTELQQVPGIGPVLYARLAPYVYVDGALAGGTAGR
ncbi:MAG: ComEA family DNA-binding protein [Alicyclobacillus sp.]|nr:ComEA family DNA-binding protein [Alicyclobacillus sp.]